MNNWISKTSSAVLRKVAPSLQEDVQLARFARSWIVPVPPSQPDAVRNAPLTMLGHRGIAFHEEEQRQRVASWSDDRHQTLFNELRNDPAINVLALGQPRILSRAGLYSTPDAEIYASMILDRQPPRVVEVGAGFSTLIARKTIQHAGYDTRIVVIDPEPRTDVKPAADELILSPVERSDLVDYD